MKLLQLACVVSVTALFQEGVKLNDNEVIPGEFIVVLQKHLVSDLRAQHMRRLGEHLANATVKKEFTINEGEFQAYHVVGVNEKDAFALASFDEVAYVEPNFVSHVDACVQQASPANWGLARSVSRVAAPYPNRFEWNDEQCGTDIEIHIMDTGIRVSHTDFRGRATWVGGGDYTGEGQVDEHGHGTHVASTAAGEVFGNGARCARIVAQKVCNRGGSCPADAQLSALEVVARTARDPTKRVVGNMSLGGVFRQASNDAVNAAHNAGASIAVSAGNSNDNACGRSPASAELAYTVMAMDSADRRSTFSSFGSCCQIFGPGTSITAAWIASDTDTRSASGTSMSSPMVAGALANVWSENRAWTNKQVEQAVTTRSTKNIVQNIGAGSPNNLVFKDCGVSQ